MFSHPSSRPKLSAQLFAFTAFMLFSLSAAAQENYFVTYSHQMEEPGDLEVAIQSLTASPKAGNTFHASTLELEYGVKGWWTSELYLDGQTTARGSTVFTGYKLENRFRPMMREHWINPVLYVEFANVNGADKSMREIVGHDGNADAGERNDRSEKKREIELKLIGSSNVKGWNISENFIAEKNLKALEPWEFGYALGVSRPLSLAASATMCTFCKENFSLGAEMYGGLGDHQSFGLRDTSHYIAPVASLRTPMGMNFKLSPGFGLNDNSHGFTFRFGVSYEIEQIASKLRRR
ncbi:MAG: hypothetical protein JWO13_31 [Acidobacteriales bacterium]|nr:hypothetical protein [Terriglobales bacterium]